MMRVCLLLMLLLAAGPALRADTWASYMLHCGGCHLTDGSGAPPEVPGLHELGQLVSLPGGRAYVIRVPGVAQAPATDRELTEILNWILRTFNARTLDPQFEPLTEAEVNQARRHVLADPLKYRTELMQARVTAR